MTSTLTEPGVVASADPSSTRVRPARPFAILGRSIRDEKRSLIGWSLGVASIIVIELAMYPSIRGNDMSQLMDAYPDALKEMFNLSDFSSGRGFVGAELFSFVLPIMFIIFGVLWGSDTVAGEEERHTIDLLLAAPVSRRRVVLEKAMAVSLGMVALGVVTAVTLGIGDVVLTMHIGAANLIAVVLATTVLAVLLAMVALSIGAATGHRGAARGITAGLAVGAYLLSSLAGLASWLMPWRPLSPWYHALGVDPINTGLDPWRPILVLVLAAGFLAWGTWAFDRRDLGT